MDEIERVVNTYFDHLKTRALQRVRVANRRYQDKWKKMSIDDLKIELEDEIVDALVYKGLVEYRETTNEN